MSLIRVKGTVEGGISVDDSTIVELLLDRDESAIGRISEKYGPRLRRIANSIVDDSALAEECENDTYMAAWNAIPPHEPRTYLFAFLTKIVRQIALDRCKERNRLKRNARLIELTAEMEQCIPGRETADGSLDAQVLGGLISTFLRGQTAERRRIFLRRYWYMDSVAEIAQRFQVSEGKVKSVLFRVRNELRTFLKKEGYPL